MYHCHGLQKHIYATTSKDIKIKVEEHNKVMRGVRNTADGLYDIILKIDENYVLHKIKNLLLKAKNVKISPTIFSKPVSNTSKENKTIANILMKKFNNIILPIIKKNQNHTYQFCSRLLQNLMSSSKRTRPKRNLSLSYMIPCSPLFLPRGLKR